MSRVTLKPIDLPTFGVPSSQPVVPKAVYEARLRATRKRMQAEGLDALVVYGDREHFANMAYLTGFDPRFEEALLIVLREGPPVILVGLEGMSYVKISPIELKVELYPPFSLLGMPRGETRPLHHILEQAGITPAMRVGVAGWKYYSEIESGTNALWSEVPSFIVDTLRHLVGDPAHVVNSTPIFMHPRDGLRIVNELEQLASFEYAATLTSQGVRNVLFGVQPGQTETDLAKLIEYPGLPFSAHFMLSSGERAAMGLPSPSLKTIQHGEPIFVAFGLWGALNARAGFVVEDASQLPAHIQDYVERLVKPYYRAAVAWYETVGIGVTGGELYNAVHREVGDPFFGVTLNPGHYIHLDEWVNSPVAPASDIPLTSGMALQVDIIPATGSPYFTSNVEDGIALADETLRDRIRDNYPEMWQRIQARRTFMREVLGIQLKPEVLPLSNIPAYLPPFWLQPRLAMCACGA